MRTRLTLLLLLLSSSALAQAPSPAQMGVTQGTPQSLQALDSSKTWVPIGTLDPNNHTWRGFGAYIDVRSYGADPTGVADSAPAFRSALAACMAGGFRKVLVPSGKYQLASFDAAKPQGSIVLGDGQKIAATVTINSGSTSLASASAVFTPDMVNAGVDIVGAGDKPGNILPAQILAVVDATHVTLDLPATHTVTSSAQTLQIGHSNTCEFEGETRAQDWNYLYNNAGPGRSGNWGVTLFQAPGQNRPIFFSTTKTGGTTIRNMQIDGGGQTACAAGCEAGKLYTVTADDGSPFPEGSFRLFNSVIQSGFHGNLYFGLSRGVGVVRDFYSLYGGQSTADACVVVKSYDFNGTDWGAGNCVGTGVFFVAGSQYTNENWALWFNNNNLILGGAAVAYFTSTNLNLQSAICNGVVDQAGAAKTGSHLFANTTFESNNTSGNAACGDINAASNNQMAFSGVGFIGNLGNPSGNRATYNVMSSGTSQVLLNNVRWGNTPNVSGPFQVPAQVLLSNVNVELGWTPALAGATTPGSPVYIAGTPTGTWSRNNNEVTVHFTVQVSSLGGAAGQLIFTGLPLQNSTTVNELGHCVVNNWTGWTAQAGYTNLTAIVGVNTQIIYFYENGSGKTIAPVQASEFSGTPTLQGMCTYHVDS